MAKALEEGEQGVGMTAFLDRTIRYKSEMDIFLFQIMVVMESTCRVKSPEWIYFAAKSEGITWNKGSTVGIMEIEKLPGSFQKIISFA